MYTKLLNDFQLLIPPINVLTFFPPDWRMLRRFLNTTLYHEINTSVERKAAAIYTGIVLLRIDLQVVHTTDHVPISAAVMRYMTCL